MPRSKRPKTIHWKDYQEIEKQKGSNPGGFFKHLESGKEYYIKWLPEHLSEGEKQFFRAEDLAKGKYKNRHRNRFNNEFLAGKIYDLYGVPVPKTEFITFVDEKGVTHYGIASEKKEGLERMKPNHPDFQQFCNKAQEDFLIDVLLSNYDVVGLRGDNLFEDPNREPFRLDPGGALIYYAQGKPKKNEFNAVAGEYEDMETGKQQNTQFSPNVLDKAGLVFSGVSDSHTLLISLKKLLSISDEQLRSCVEINGFDIDTTGKGQKKNESIIALLLDRKKNLVDKATSKISNRLIYGLKTADERKDYLQKAGISQESISTICIAIDQRQLKRVNELILAAITPSKPKETLIIPPIKHVVIEPKVIAFDMSNEEMLFNDIVRHFLLSRCPENTDTYPDQYRDNDKGFDQIQRVKHGGMHASRTALHTEKIISLLQESGYEAVVNLTPKDRFLMKVAAMFHDTGRGSDTGNDEARWVEASAENARNWLLERTFSQEDANKVYDAIVNKDRADGQANNVYALVLAASDSLDWVRSHSSEFQARYMPNIIKQYIPENTLTQLASVGKKIAVDQGDSPRSHGGIEGSFSIAVKKTFEHSSEGCYSAIKKNYAKFSSELGEITLPKKTQKDLETCDKGIQNTKQPVLTPEKYAKYIEKLRSITQTYEDALTKNEDNQPIHAILLQLLNQLKNKPTEATIHGFYAILDQKASKEEESAEKETNLQIIKKNTEQSTARFFAGLAIITTIIVTGLIPGLIAMAVVYKLTNKTPMTFFKPHSQNFDEDTQQLKTDLATEIEENKPKM